RQKIFLTGQCLRLCLAEILRIPVNPLRRPPAWRGHVAADSNDRPTVLFVTRRDAGSRMAAAMDRR
ncbi:hypothetical protein ACQCQP_23960, partial [Ralstonia pseudosolanacearum]|uniref:hypothetical protein n=1 Tax=Ralstonia pseudosolanacearum TaxID=1310165 RepID=UPI003CEAD26B